MKVFYAKEDTLLPTPVAPGGMVIVLEPEESAQQELIVRGFLPIVDNHSKAQLLEILKYCAVSHDGLDA